MRAEVRVGSCVDDARIARGIWRAACGRVQVMCPACWCGHMTAGPDVIRGWVPIKSAGSMAHRPKQVIPSPARPFRITPSSPSQLECARRRDL